MSQRSQQHEGDASQTSQTTTQSSEPDFHQEPPRVLRLRGARTSTGRSVQWADGVVDNEGLGRKSSKVCCIYHKPKAVGESSSESDSSSSSDSDSEDSATENKKAGGNKDGACGHSNRRRTKRSRKEKRSPSPNAYEKVPKYNKPEGSQKEAKKS